LACERSLVASAFRRKKQGLSLTFHLKVEARQIN
jgi:hypothetical protein